MPVNPDFRYHAQRLTCGRPVSMPRSELHFRSAGHARTRQARDAFPAARLERIVEVEADHFWHAPRRRLLLDVIDAAGLARGSRMLDVGSGSGSLVTALTQRGYDASGIDPWYSGAGPGQAGTIEALPLPDASLQAACAFDVLEHVDDVAGLRELFRVIEPDGKLFLSVPAHRGLWSARDELAGDRRRYSRRLLRERVAAAGFEIERVFGYQFLLLPALFAARWVARRTKARDTTAEDRPPAWINRFLRAINLCEVRLGTLWRPPTGSSLILLASRPALSDADAEKPAFERSAR
jgi:SAM-dependent methyltransferase